MSSTQATDLPQTQSLPQPGHTPSFEPRMYLCAASPVALRDKISGSPYKQDWSLDYLGSAVKVVALVQETSPKRCSYRRSFCCPGSGRYPASKLLFVMCLRTHVLADEKPASRSATSTLNQTADRTDENGGRSTKPPLSTKRGLEPELDDLLPV